MTQNSIPAKIAFALLTITILLLLNRFFPLERNLMINLLSLCGLIFIAIYALVNGFKNISLGIVYGLIISVVILIYYVFQLIA